MKVVRESHGRDPEKLLELGDHLLEERVGLRVLEVAHVGREIGLVLPGQAHRVLQLRSDRENGRGGEAEWNRLGHRPARAPDGLRRARDDPDDRVVGARVDFPVVE